MQSKALGAFGFENWIAQEGQRLVEKKAELAADRLTGGDIEERKMAEGLEMKKQVDCASVPARLRLHGA